MCNYTVLQGLAIPLRASDRGKKGLCSPQTLSMRCLSPSLSPERRFYPRSAERECRERGGVPWSLRSLQAVPMPVSGLHAH